MGKRREIQSGSVFGEWTVLRVDSSGRSGLIYLCQCSCGRIGKIQGGTLRLGKSRMCRSCSARKRMTTHGEAGSVEYRAWAHMHQRCSASNDRAKDYFCRGISVCERWSGEGGFERFLEDVGRRPSSSHSIDRVDNDLGYEPGNVRWATPSQQQRNTRRTLDITIDGETRCLAEWAEISPVKENTIYYRLRRGWPPRDAVFGRLRPGEKGPRVSS